MMLIMRKMMVLFRLSLRRARSSTILIYSLPQNLVRRDVVEGALTTRVITAITYAALVVQLAARNIAGLVIPLLSKMKKLEALNTSASAGASRGVKVAAH